MTLKAISELYQKGVNTINQHIKNIYAEGELEENRTIRENRIVQTEGNREVERTVRFYNLELIIAVGYRVRSSRGTQFRRWATERLNEYLVKGFAMDDERLRSMRNIGDDYFDELLEDTIDALIVVIILFVFITMFLNVTMTKIVTKRHGFKNRKVSYSPND